MVVGVAVRQDSEGAGKYSIKECGSALSSISDREKFAPFGLFDGESSTVATVILNPDTQEEKDIGLYFSNALVQKGARVKMMTSGGGGYGPIVSLPRYCRMSCMVTPQADKKRTGWCSGSRPLWQTYTIDAKKGFRQWIAFGMMSNIRIQSVQDLFDVPAVACL